MIVFKFRVIRGEARGPRSRLDRALAGGTEEVPIEQIWTERYFVNPSAEQREAERREQRLVHALELELRQTGHYVGRLKIVPDGEYRPIFCDLYDKTTKTLVEAKGSVTREAVRMAIGQLLDYRRFVDAPVRLSVLLPEQPRPDLMGLLESVDIEAQWPTDIGFVSSSLITAQ